MWTVPHGLWLSRIEKAVRERDRSPRSALDVACGTGMATELLARRGYAPVVGVDLSESMVRVARTKAGAKKLDIAYLAQDAAELDLPGHQFDLILSLFDSLNYIVDPERLARAFQRIARHAAPGAIFAFDMNSVFALSTNMFTQDDEQGPVKHSWTAHWDPQTRLCRVEMDFWVRDQHSGETRHFTETHLQRAYELADVKAMLDAAGFIKTEVFGNYGPKSPNASSDRWLFVTEKP